MKLSPDIITTIDVHVDELERRKTLFAAAAGGNCSRCPVLVQWSDFSYPDACGVGLKEYLTDPLVHVTTQILGQKAMLETLDTDAFTFDVGINFGGGCSEFGAEIAPQGDASRLASHPWIKEASDLDRLAAIDPNTTGMNVKMAEWTAQLNAVAKQYPVQFEGGEVFYPLAKQEHLPMVGGICDPFSVAVDLMGATDFFMKLFDDPPFIHAMLDILTGKIIAMMTTNSAKAGFDGTTFVSSDYSVMLSPDQYVEFALPALQQIKKALPGPMKLHHCQIPTQILDPILSELKPEIINGFKAAQNVIEEFRAFGELVAGRVYLEPYLDGTHMLHQSEDEIYRDARGAIEIFSQHGPFHLGAMACDGMPFEKLENLNAVKRASRDTSSDANSQG